MPFDFSTPLRITSARDDGASMGATGCMFTREAFATTEEVRYAHQLRLQLRARLLRRPTPLPRPWSVGAD